MSAIRNNQNRKHGSAVHLLQLERRIPSTTVTHTGAVCTTCRTIPLETTPTTYRAITSSRAHHASIRLSGYITSRLAAAVAIGDESPLDSARHSNSSMIVVKSPYHFSSTRRTALRAAGMHPSVASYKPPGAKEQS